MDHRRGALIGGGVAVLVVLLAAVVWFGVIAKDDGGAARPGLKEGDPASEAADAFAAKWAAGRLVDVAVTPESGDMAAQVQAITAGLGPAGAKPAKVAVTSMREVPAPEGSEAPARVAATVEVTWQFDPKRAWTYETEVELVEPVADPAAGEEADGADEWLVDWKPTAVHRRLTSGDTLKLVRMQGTRGEILGPDGQPIVGLKPVVHIGIQPGAAADPASLATNVASIVGVDGAALAERVAAAGDGQVVSVVTLRQAAYDEVAYALEGVPGVILTEDEIPLAPTREFARALLGTTGEATPEQIAASGGRLQAGDLTGQSGLQAAQDEVLGGTPSLSIRVAPDPAGENEPYVLEELKGTAPRSIQITIDPDVQAAADAALASAPGPAALVAIRPSTGEVLAVANGPAGADSYNRALVGKYPPGSTFKVASAYALFEQGLTPDTVVNCPATIVVGKEFQNAEGEVLGEVPFRKDFADSCNTAFVGQSREISAEQLADAAARLGYRKVDLGVPVATPSVPITDSETEHAADMIGQGKVEASPFSVALASASVAAGRSVEPRLVVDPDAEPEPGAPLAERPVADLQSVMREVVLNGTGSAVLGIPGGPVSGKTGTAEFGNEDPPETHAWFTGYQGDLAFAVLVEGGGFGGQVAAPIAATFLSDLAAG